jgi:beta-lactamase regulating signal transducer with metallopeptidase domain
MITPALAFWWRLFTTLALEVCCLAALGFAAQRLAHSAFWRRTAWQVVVVCLLAVAASEWTGLGRALAKHFAPRQAAAENKPAPNIGPAASGDPVAVQIGTRPAPLEKETAAVWWPGLIALAGTVLLLGRTALAQGLLLALRCKRNTIAHGPMRESLARLSPRLGLRRKVGLRRMSALVSPMAFGVLRPCIGLPAQFETKFSPAEQDAVLAHELAHLAARDPLWFLLADLAVATLWWHPAAWWARQRLHVISEQAADQATALVPEGPDALARCLVALAKEMTGMEAWGWVGINGGGFRSNLGRRIEGLLQLSGGPPPRLLGRGAGAIKMAAMLLAAPLTILVFGSIQASQGPSDETWQIQLEQSWRQSPAGLLLLAKRDDPPQPKGTNLAENAAPPNQFLSIERQTLFQNGKFLYEMGQYDEAEGLFNQVLADDPSNRSAKYYLALTKEARFMEREHKLHPIPPDTNQESLPPHHPIWATNLIYTSKGRQRILAMLDNIMLDEVSYDLPLKEVLRRLSHECRERDPDGVGVNLMIRQGSDSINSQTSPSDATQQPDIGAEVMIRISRPLKHLRLADVLDAITKVADKPIRYTVEDYAVVFSSKPAGAEVLYTKVFRVDPKAFVQALEALTALEFKTNVAPFGPVLQAKTVSALQMIRDPTDSPATIHMKLIRLYFTSCGVDMAPPKLVFFNDRLGELLVRGTLRDLEVISNAVELLNQPPLAPKAGP